MLWLNCVQADLILAKLSLIDLILTELFKG